MKDYLNKIIRDLHQSIVSSYVLDDGYQLPEHFLEIDKQLLKKWLLELDENLNELSDFVERNHSKRLGRYFENLLRFYFDFHPNIEVLEFGKQIFSGKRTIGEMDFILRNKITTEIIHLETAVKYFAKAKGNSDFYSFICPNGSRNFGDKLDKTYSKQLKITELPETIEFLKKENYYPLKSYHFIKGMLFYHPDEIDSFQHENLNTNHQRGWWIYQKEVDTLNPDSKFRVIHKSRWLSEEICEDSGELLSKSELIEILETHFEIISQGQLIVEFQKSEDIWIEISRGFVLDNRWPNL
ncbi:MAG: DUF1853 family protein [Bacteroidota bacterium]